MGQRRVALRLEHRGNGSQAARSDANSQERARLYDKGYALITAQNAAVEVGRVAGKGAWGRGRLSESGIASRICTDWGRKTRRWDFPWLSV